MGKYRSLGSFFDRIFRNNLNDNFNDIDTDIQAQKARVDNLLNNSPQASEVLDAHVNSDGSTTYSNLKERLDTEHNNVTTQLAQNSNYILYNAVNVKMPFHGLTAAKGDGITDDTSALQAIVNYCQTNHLDIYFPIGTYLITSALNISGNGIRVLADSQATSSNGTTILNQGSTDSINITGSKVLIDSLNVKGNGGDYGAGATALNGITINNTSYVFIRNCSIQNHMNHGIYVKGNSWIIRIYDHNIITQNGGDGINSVSLGTDQTGNNLIIHDNVISNNGGSGVNWRAANLAVFGNDIESNTKSGILIDMTGATQSNAYNMGIHDNYIENNKDAQIKGITDTLGIQNLSIFDNFFNTAATSGETSILAFKGTTPYKYYYLNVGSNTYAKTGVYVTSYINGNNNLSNSCKVAVLNDYSLSNYVNMGQAELINYGVKSRSLSGLIHQKGIPWSAIGKSDNIVGNVTGNFSLDIPQQSSLYRVKTYIDTDCTNYDVKVELWAKNISDNTAPTLLTFYQTLAKSGSFSPNFLVQNYITNFRMSREVSYYLVVTITQHSAPTFMYLNDLHLEFV